MPPIGFRKRQRTSSPPPAPSIDSPIPRRNAPTSKRSKPTLFETADASVRNERSLQDNKQFLDSLHSDTSDDSSLSEADSDEFEDVPSIEHAKLPHKNVCDHGERDEEEDENVDWEDAIHTEAPNAHANTTTAAPTEITDVSISLNEDGSYVEPLVSAATIKKGPSKRERQIRIQTHWLHVQTLMWHNTVRNSWLNDSEVQQCLIDSMPEGLVREVQRWKEAMGMLSSEELEAKKQAAASAKTRGKRRAPDERKGKAREWDYDAEHAEQGVVNMSGGDPLLRLLKVLTAYWRKRFVVTAPGLRKQGYKSLRRLRDEIKGWEKNKRDPDSWGERIENIAAFRQLAKSCEGSRDVGAQLFTALLRGLGFDVRMVANLQPAGFGWSKSEEAAEKKTRRAIEQEMQIDAASEDHIAQAVTYEQKKRLSRTSAKSPASRLVWRPARGVETEPISLDDSESSLSSAPSEIGDEKLTDGDDSSVIEITPVRRPQIPRRKFDRDLAFPIYWTEVCSPATHKYYPVDPLVLSTIASNDELLQTFEPRGAKAEKSKQVICYTVAFSTDGSAKDVTVRYLKKHQLPGKTKGVRMPIDRIPIYNNKGKVRRYDEYDGFRMVMAMYDRPQRTRTKADDLEDQNELKPFKPDTSGKEVAKESLQWYKSSAEFVLEQHLRREEALRPEAQVVRNFATGKGDKAKEYAVYLRADVLTCKTVESWHKEGRAIRIGEQPVKYVPMRAVTLIRKREIEEAQRETGEKLKQGLYSIDQTEWIIPPPIENGVIPKNAFGNMDVYVPTMVPEGAVHLPLKGSAKLCKKLGIDFAEACTGFEFGKQRAVPVLTGVVVAKEHQKLVREAWRKDRAEQKRKENTKRTAAALKWWRKMLLGLRVIERMRTEYAETGSKSDEVNPFVSRKQRGAKSPNYSKPDYTMDTTSGGFIASDINEPIPASASHHGDQKSQSTLILEHSDDDNSGGFILEDEDEATHNASIATSGPITPMSLQSIARDNRQEHYRMDTNKGTQARIFSAGIAADHEQQSEEDPSDTSNANNYNSDALGCSSSQNLDHRVREPQKTASIQTTKKRTTSRAAHVDKPKPRAKRRVSMKTTPLKSKFFQHDGHAGAVEETDIDDNGESEESIAEVIRPRRTTARTRSKALMQWKS